jgi:hypothetical protein
LKRRHKALLAIFVILFGFPLLLWLAWYLTNPKPLAVFVMDKTYYSGKPDNKALSWVKKHHRFVKHDGSDYDPLKDYFGFIAYDHSAFRIRDLDSLNPHQIQQLAFENDMAYYIDSYGIYSDIWNTGVKDSVLKKIYGGVSWEDLLFWEYILGMDKLLIAENIFLPMSQADPRRTKAAGLLGVEYKGWTGKFFQTLDIKKIDNLIPSWMPRLYEQQSGFPWEFRNPGIVLIHEDGDLIVLEYQTHLKTYGPYLKTSKDVEDYYGISDKIMYPGWFEVILPLNESAEIVSWYEMDLNQKGLELLNRYNLPPRFPSVIKEGTCYYFAGDFSFYPPPQRFQQFKGGSLLELLFSDLNDPADKNIFFLAFYLPFMNRVMMDRYHLNQK